MTCDEVHFKAAHGRKSGTDRSQVAPLYHKAPEFRSSRVPPIFITYLTKGTEEKSAM
ncbi:uncharacterized protein ACLA_073690 [Aspergillus clavatus NRRL 1]|uniref:Uncharacterized protein n=1 Tax=Aspergillus clavatus (strain ATCC 1007 / CBS 513.65 / DSM 816 / NCTC 3887 / NRRL 1 / QM 1276 / 107) TaxID=344612 RepID=A1C7G3_ASPCL|nr:uncharacterized protein ACLA_073690 [Aspergillus clavatus NRRL 1]EAW14334.1 hypothetical protein ACLA_073690 [Aspergillus clavatus NRRL 1]